MFFKDAYGTRSVNERIFPNRPYTRFRTFRLRDGGTDYKWAMMRDTLMGMSGIDMPSMPSSDHNRAVVFLDGEYYGQMEVREHLKQDYLEQVYGIDANAVDIVDVNGSLAAQQGTLEGFNAWWAWVTSHRTELAADFDLLRRVIDPETLANYLAIELYGNNVDWPGNNERFWHARAQDSPWKFAVNDLDLTFDCPFTGAQGPAANSFGRLGGGGYTSTLFQVATANPTFKTYLINVFADLMNTSLSQAVAEAHFMTLVNEMTPLMPEFYARWPQNTVQGWMNETAKVLTYLRAREAGFLPRIQAQFALGNQPRYLLTVNVNDVTMGTVQVNTVNLGLGGRLVDVSRPWTGRYFPNVPITVTALPAPGHKFVGWQGATSSLQPTETLTFNSDSAITATFAPDPMWKPPVKPQPPVPPPGMRNLASGGTATQSSSSNATHAALAIDGDPSRAAAANSMATTNSEFNAWWQVDLGQAADIFRVDLFTRADMADFAIFVSTDDMSGRSYASLAADQSVWQFVQKGPCHIQQSRLVGRTGRYVRVQRAGIGSMGIAEVQVMGVPSSTLVPDPALLRNLALGKTATSSSDGGGAASLAVDANADPSAMRTTALTRVENTPWWEVDLGDPHTIGAVHVYGASRPANFVVFVSPQPMAGKSLAELEADATIWKKQVPGAIGGLIHLSAETVGRYVRVARKDSNVSLGLAEVVVLGLVPVAPLSAPCVPGCGTMPPMRKPVMLVAIGLFSLLPACTDPEGGERDAGDGTVGDMALPATPPDFTCAAPRTACGASCVNLADDRQNCGTCGNACPPGVSCLSGACTPTCDPGLTRCSGMCVDTMTDGAHCGACGKACDKGRLCVKGVCDCAPPMTTCLDTCVDLQSDARNCALCGKACAPGVHCVKGVCGGNGCPPGQSPCGGNCYDLKADAAHCGACGVACNKGESCLLGVCGTCAQGKDACAGQCVDLQSDFDNCGACSKACKLGESCIGGFCDGGCGPGRANCNGNCVDLTSDISNCGACGVACNKRQQCLKGMCI